MKLRFSIIALVASVATAQAQGLVPYYGPDGQVYYRRAPDAGYAAPGVPPNIIAPERPRGSPRPRNAPIAVAPLEPLSPEPAPPMPQAPVAPATTGTLKAYVIVYFTGTMPSM